MNKDLIKKSNMLNEFIKSNWRKSLNEPSGILKHKFIDPASVYRGQLWDWDSFFCGTALLDVYDDTFEYIKGCVMNFIDNQAQDGSIPYSINANPENELSYLLPDTEIKCRDKDSDLNSIKPLLAQMALMVYEKENDAEWLKSILHSPQNHIEHWEKTQKISNGLFVWRSYRGSGTDNNPAVYGRPLNSSAAVELNCLMHAEYISMAKIANACNNSLLFNKYTKSAKKLMNSINRHMWDNIDGMYYTLDVLSQKPELENQEITWDVYIKLKKCTCFMPLWAKIAPKEYVKRIITEHLVNKNEFWSDYGIRTLAKNEQAYSTTETSNPSNWQGPIWIVSSYLIFKGVLNYGYYDIAESIAENLITVMINDINANGVLHEYYNPETGKSNINPGFMNWNALAGLMIPELLKYNA